ncbi:MAG: hypothetical protein L3J52_07550 [Proteobacteria bacterium]|nr:hypothetical protein [Pseudomonadota bacterium]
MKALLQTVSLLLAIDTFALGFIEISDDTFFYQLETAVDPIAGVYSVRGIPDGEFRIFLSPNQGNLHIPEIYGGSQCNSCWSLIQDGNGSVLAIAGANTLSNIDFTPELGASISGFLVDVLDLNANYDIGLIMVFNELNNNLAFITIEGNMLDPLNDGAYTVGGLLAGSYYVQGGDLGRQYFQRELFESIPCPWTGCDRGEGDPVNRVRPE